MDRRQVDHVEPHRRDRRQPARRGPERAVRPLGRALRTGEELVPRPEQRPLPLHQQRQRLRRRDQLPQRMTRQHRVHLGRQRGREPGGGGPGLVAQGADGREEHAVAPVVGDSGRGALVEPGALLQDQLGVHARRDLDLGVAPPGRDGVAPGLDGEGPQPRAARGDGGAPPVGARGQFPHGGPGSGAVLRILQYDIGGDRVMTLTEHGGRDLERFAGDRLGGPASALDDRTHVEDGYTPDGRGRSLRCGGLLQARWSGVDGTRGGRVGAGRRGC